MCRGFRGQQTGDARGAERCWQAINPVQPRVRHTDGRAGRTTSGSRQCDRVRCSVHDLATRGHSRRVQQRWTALSPCGETPPLSDVVAHHPTPPPHSPGGCLIYARYSPIVSQGRHHSHAIGLRHLERRSTLSTPCQQALLVNLDTIIHSGMGKSSLRSSVAPLCQSSTSRCRHRSGPNVRKPQVLDVASRRISCVAAIRRVGPAPSHVMCRAT
jgi:hypothetical protein